MYALKHLFFFIGVLLGTSVLWFWVAEPIGLLRWLGWETWEISFGYVVFLSVTYIVLNIIHWDGLKR